MSIGKYHLNPASPWMSAVDVLRRVVFNYRPIDEHARALRGIISDPTYEKVRVDRVVEYVNEHRDEGHRLVDTVKEVILELRDVLEARKGAVGINALPKE